LSGPGDLDPGDERLDQGLALILAASGFQRPASKTAAITFPPVVHSGVCRS
jgi:hypothetical protein